METIEITHWYWLVLAAVLLIAEILGTAGFLLGILLASLVMAALTALGLVDDWRYQALWFGLLSVTFSVLYWKLFRNFNSETNEPLLNDRAAQMIGRRISLSEDIVAGQGRTMIHDTYWKVKTDGDLSKGTAVEVVGSEGMVLLIRVVE